MEHVETPTSADDAWFNAETVRFIAEGRYKNVALQLPDFLLSSARVIATQLKERLEREQLDAQVCSTCKIFIEQAYLCWDCAQQCLLV
jgi:diphthamide synthase subunit DPH2